MIYRAKYVNPNPHIPEPIKKSPIEFIVVGLDKPEDITSIQKAQVNLLSLPTDIEDALIKHKCSVTLMSEEAYKKRWRNDYHEDTTSTGCYGHDAQRIRFYVNTTGVLYHEVGHFIDGWYGNKNEFNAIYKEELDQICEYALSDYAKKSAAEGFAEAFMAYMWNKENVKMGCPKTYAYISKLLDQLKEF